MKPPEKIWLSRQWSMPSRKEWCWSVREKKANLDVTEYEYHLAPQWVSVEDGMPHLDAEVWMLFDDGRSFLGYYEEFQTEDMFGSPVDYSVFTDRMSEEIYNPTAWCYANPPVPSEVKK